MVFWGTTGSGQWWSTSFKDHMDYFRAEDTASPLGANVNAYYPRPLFNNKNHKTQTAYLQNAAYMRLKNLQLGYAFPEWITSKLKMQRLYVYANAQNLFTIMWKKGYEGYDPERNTFDSGTNYYPTPRIFTFGINLNF